MKTAPHYPIRLHWSEEDGEWVATSPAWPALSSLAESPQAAATGLLQAIRLASQANAELGRPVPESLTIADLKRAGSLLKIAALATLAGLPAQTLHSKIRRSGGLTPEESAALHNALAGVNLAVAK
jgi:predicted RNase H-like HicB family nuclease